MDLELEMQNDETLFSDAAKVGYRNLRSTLPKISTFDKVI